MGIIQKGVHGRQQQPCRFHAPWPLVENTHFDDGLLKVARKVSMVNRYNEAMAIGLRHNHDISLVLSKNYGLSMIYYITNYATKLETPTWKRIALAEEVMRLVREENDMDRQSGRSSSAEEQTTKSKVQVRK